MSDNYFSIPNLNYIFGKTLPDEFYEGLYPLLERGYGKKVDVFAYGSRSMPYYKEHYPRDSFGYPTEDSDIDLAVPTNPLFENILMFEGWASEGSYPEGDGITISVWNKVIAGYNVQISVRNRDFFKAMRYFWTNLSPEFYWEFLNKRSPHYFGKVGVANYLRQQLDMIKYAPIDEVSAVDQDFVYDPAKAVLRREEMFEDPLSYHSAYDNSRIFLNVSKMEPRKRWTAEEVGYARVAGLAANIAAEPDWVEEVWRVPDMRAVPVNPDALEF